MKLQLPVLTTGQHQIRVAQEIFDLRKVQPERDKLIYIHVVCPCGKNKKYLGVFAHIKHNQFIHNEYIFNALDFQNSIVEYLKFCLEKTDCDADGKKRTQYYWQYASVS